MYAKVTLCYFTRLLPRCSQ